MCELPEECRDPGTVKPVVEFELDERFELKGHTFIVRRVGAQLLSVACETAKLKDGRIDER